MHHLTQKHVANAPSTDEVEDALLNFIGSSTIVAHNAAFDRSFLHRLKDRSWICTMRFAQHLWADAPAYSNNVLRYWLQLEDAELDGLVPHRAVADAIVTGFLFHRELRVFGGRNPEATLAQVERYIAHPVKIEKLRFGKHRGVAIRDVPSDYLRWLVSDASLTSGSRKGKADPDTMAAVQQELDSRGP